MALASLAAHATTALAGLPMDDPAPLLDGAGFTTAFTPAMVAVGGIAIAALALGVGLWVPKFGVGYGKSIVKKAAS